jgi:hypothetical protein
LARNIGRGNAVNLRLLSKIGIRELENNLRLVRTKITIECHGIFMRVTF